MNHWNGPAENTDKTRNSHLVGNILVVDDIAANVRLLSGILKVAGFGVVGAYSGGEALTLAASNEFDAVLLDVMMPDMDGFEVCRRLKNHESNAFLPVVMVTALQETSDRVRAIEVGADDFLSKPVDELEVVARLKSLVRAKRQHDSLENAYRELHRAEAMRDDLLAMVVHDLRTPLTSLMVSLDMLGNEQLGQLNESQQGVLEISRRGGAQLLAHVNQLLDFHRLESGQFHLKTAPIDPASLINDAVEQVVPLAESRRVRLLWEVADHLPLPNLDPHLMVRVLVNLLGNAIKFSPQGTVTASVKHNDENNALIFTVSDTGPGIPAEAHGAIFEKFGQVDPDKNDRRNSTGIGLAFCKLATELHGGRIWVESQIGQGSTFFIEVPNGYKSAP